MISQFWAALFTRRSERSEMLNAQLRALVMLSLSA
jgi:hypothetical protein